MTSGPGSPSGERGPEESPSITRRAFVGAGVAVGAAVVWKSSFPFADAAISQTISAPSGDPAGPTGPTGPTGHHGGGGGGGGGFPPTGPTGPTGTTTTTTTTTVNKTVNGPSGPTGPTGNTKGEKRRRCRIEIINRHRLLKVDKSGHVHIWLKNPCHVKFTGTINIGTLLVSTASKHRVNIGSARFSLEPGKKKRVNVHLSDVVLKLVSQGHTVIVRVTVSVQHGRTVHRMFKIHNPG